MVVFFLATITKHSKLILLDRNENTCARWIGLENEILKLAFEFSVTRFGEFSPLWVTIIVLWPFRKYTFSFGQNFELILANFICYWANFIVANGQTYYKQSSHLVTLPLINLFRLDSMVPVPSSVVVFGSRKELEDVFIEANRRDIFRCHFWINSSFVHRKKLRSHMHTQLLKNALTQQFQLWIVVY